MTYSEAIAIQKKHPVALSTDMEASGGSEYKMRCCLHIAYRLFFIISLKCAGNCDAELCRFRFSGLPQIVSLSFCPVMYPTHEIRHPVPNPDLSNLHTWLHF
jgi:hypothetical protein